MKNCIFCKIINKEIPADIVYEDSKFLAFLDIAPVNKGHTLVIPKEHYENIYDIPEELYKDLSAIIKKTAISVKKAVHADGMNIGMNNEKASGQLVFHVHIHVMPRFKNDGLELWHGKKLSEQEMKEIRASVKKAF